MKKTEKDVIVSSKYSLIDALEHMDKIGHKLLAVTEEQKFIGLLSIGDIQRAIIRKVGMTEKISTFMRTEFKVANKSSSEEEIKDLMLRHRMEFCPVVTNERIDKIFFWEEFFSTKREPTFKRFNLPIVIMAGGKGTRLLPLTSVIPKPLIPLKDKSMLEEIITRFTKYGCDEFIITTNYKSEMIEFYINSLGLPEKISFIKEQKELGTAGSLSLLKNLSSTFFVSNCDILIDEEYDKILEFHRKGNFDLTVVGAVQNYPIPYGTLKTSNNGQLIELQEKPDVTIITNSGFYILEPSVLKHIPTDMFFNITDLINVLLEKNPKKVGVFPISNGSWKDMGVWDEFLNNKSND